jgi:hypothetical protein
MNYRLNSVASRIRLLSLTALIAVLGFVFFTQFSDSSVYNDDTPRLRIAEMQEFTGDTEPPSQDEPPHDGLLTSVAFIFANTVVLCIVIFSKVFPRLTFLYHVRPRSPPLR